MGIGPSLRICMGSFLGWRNPIPPSVRLGLANAFAFFASFFFYFFSRILGQILLLWLLFMHCAWTVAAKFDLSKHFQPISAHHALCMDPQISFFNNFFIKNGSHGTIHTFKNYFAIVFFRFQFQFQFSDVSKRTSSYLGFLFFLLYFYVIIHFIFKQTPSPLLLCHPFNFKQSLSPFILLHIYIYIYI